MTECRFGYGRSKVADRTLPVCRAVCLACGSNGAVVDKRMCNILICRINFKIGGNVIKCFIPTVKFLVNGGVEAFGMRGSIGSRCGAAVGDSLLFKFRCTVIECNGEFAYLPNGIECYNAVVFRGKVVYARGIGINDRTARSCRPAFEGKACFCKRVGCKVLCGAVGHVEIVHRPCAAVGIKSDLIGVYFPFCIEVDRAAVNGCNVLDTCAVIINYRAVGRGRPTDEMSSGVGKGI